MIGDGLVSLTDLWKSQGAKNRNHPAMWVRNDSAEKFIEEVGTVTNLAKSQLLSVTTGRFGGTFAHWQIALWYTGGGDRGEGTNDPAIAPGTQPWTRQQLL